jgi:hypothetical protein
MKGNDNEEGAQSRVLGVFIPIFFTLLTATL